jgi:hypothetical protein
MNDDIERVAQAAQSRSQARIAKHVPQDAPPIPLVWQSRLSQKSATQCAGLARQVPLVHKPFDNWT